MPLLQIRDCPEDIYKKIAHAAKNKKRTIAQQAVTLLEKSLGQEQTNTARRKDLLKKIKEREIPDYVKEAPADAWIREDRER
ncbi:MAG: hypothetical protein FD137_441 [Spirochaetes bacterium]|nr:MAG: hypothetical protein FD137_441 [Spirochaetota bacterium]